jgi:hypothetical protein
VEFIVELGTEIERTFRDAQYDERQFPEIARRALEAHKVQAAFSIADLVRWVHAAPQLPKQSESSFGEPPVLLYAGRRFYIEALFWMDGTTSVHQHGFSGAFQVLAGSSIHTQFRFAPEHVVNKGLVLGALDAHAPELLRVGDARTILAGDGLTHSVFHLDRPSVSLVVRTYEDLGARPQFRYLHPGIAIASFHYDARLPRLLELFAMLFGGKLPERVAVVGEYLERADLHSSILTIEKIAGAPRAELGPLVEIVCRRHGFAAAWVRAMVEELRRQRMIVERRHTVTSAELRFLLALLLNVERRDTLLRLVAAEVPDRDPIEQIVEWVGAMSPPKADGGEEQALSYALGEVELAVFRHLLQQRSVDEILVALADEYDDVAGQEETVRQLCLGLQRAALFRNLLRPAPRLVEESHACATATTAGC